ncbi:MAG: DUF305 domain-containing protein [Synechococcaceae cyanobacterium]
MATAALLPLALQPAVQGAPKPLEPPGRAAVSALGRGAGPLPQRSSDARFIVMMIPHHQGAIAMAELAITRARRPEIKALAQRIITSQSREIAQMRQWYQQWYGGEVPAWRLPAGVGMGPGMGMGMGPGRGMGMGPGMGMDSAGMGPGMGMGMGTSLEALKSATDFDRAFIEQMIPHQRMGVMMASHAAWTSEHPQLRELEAAMVRVQSQEIEQMAQWYRQWFGRSGG